MVRLDELCQINGCTDALLYQPSARCETYETHQWRYAWQLSVSCFYLNFLPVSFGFSARPHHVCLRPLAKLMIVSAIGSLTVKLVLRRRPCDVVEFLIYLLCEY